jgi:hemoglobin/transferrin/lactoferrin receptor protein
MSDEEVVVRAFWLDYWKKRKMMKGSQFRAERTVNAGSLLVLLSFLLFAGMAIRAQDDVPKQRRATSTVESVSAPPSLDQKGGVNQTIKAVASDGLTPVPFAVILNKNTGQQVMTDASGSAVISRAIGSDTLLIRSVGFMDKIILPGQPVRTSVRMVEDLISLETAQVVSEGLVDASSASLSTQLMLLPHMQNQVARLEVPQTAAELLWSTGSVLVQQSQQGGGSPIIRGFEANRILLVVDGVRMNNAIYRSGHLQNAITVDPNILQRTDVLLGPHSILFGSDALGGVIHYHTRMPKLGRNDFQVNASGAYRSPNQSQSWHADMMISRDRWGSLTSVTRSEYGDLRMGKWRPHGSETWGLDTLFAGRVDGNDVELINDDPTIQKGSGYSQVDVLQKFRIRVPGAMLDLNFQWSASSDIPRYDLSSDSFGGTLKWAEWNYGPQKRAMGSARYTRTVSRWNLQWQTLLAYQTIEESRIKRRFGDDWRETQVENVSVLNGFSTLQKSWFSGLSLTAGISGSFDRVQSEAWKMLAFPADSVAEPLQRLPIDTRYPNKGSSMGTAAAFATTVWNVRQHQLAGGLRWSRSRLDAAFEPTASFALPFETVNMNNAALTGGFSDRWTSANRVWSTNTAFSTGFRHPNIDDMGKVREKGGFVLVPNDSLRPEYLYSLEQSVQWDLNAKEQLTLTFSAFGSRLNDAIVPQNVTLDGAELFFVDGDSARVQTNVNASYAHIGGLRAEVQAKLNSSWNFEAAINWTGGHQFTPNPLTGLRQKLPMSHIPPIFGRIASHVKGRWWTLECYVLFSGFKSEDRFGPYSTDNLDLMLPEGVPAWWTFNTELSAQLHPKIECRLGVRNALDRHYRVFASGISAPGRGLYTSLHAAF